MASRKDRTFQCMRCGKSVTLKYPSYAKVRKYCSSRCYAIDKQPLAGVLAAQSAAGAVTRGMVQEFLSRGISKADTARLCGISRQRVHQIVRSS